MVNTPNLAKAWSGRANLFKAYYNEVLNAGATDLSDQKGPTSILVV